jgi:cellulose synthase/poly-beta-1,6-N-acetylglucosamine synthase-like glycosyltransferase
MEIILNILYFYAAVYSVYFLALAARNLSDKKFAIEKRYSQYEDKDNLAIVIYAHNSRNSLENLIKEIKSQDYPINHVKIFVILDNCIDNSEEIFAGEKFIHVINIKDVGTIGKDKAISVLLERLSRDQSIDSYVFVDGDRNIPVNFLSTVNAALINHSVVSGETLIVTDTLGPVDKIKAAYQKYHMNFIRKARSLFGLASQADSGVFIIKKDIVDKITSVDFKDIDSELKYSLLLSKIGYPCYYNPNIQTFVDTTNYEFKKVKLSTRLALFRSCFTQIIRPRNFVFAEHTVSLLYPNIWLLVFIYAALLKHSYKYYFIVDFKIVLFTFLLLALGFGMSLIKSRLKPLEICLLFLYPVYSLCHIVKNLPPVRAIKNKVKNKEDSGTEKLVVEAIVTSDGRELPCKLEFISENGLAKVQFIFKKKRFITSSHIRMVDALQELKSKLYEYNFILKICSCCCSFEPSIDGSTNMLKGTCNCGYPSPLINEAKQTLVWNSCMQFTPGVINSLMHEISEEAAIR